MNSGANCFRVEPTDHVDSVGWTREAFGVILDYVAGLKYALDGAGFDVELIVAEAVLSAASSVRVIGD